MENTAKKLKKRHALLIAIFFGVFQAAMPLIGYFVADMVASSREILSSAGYLPYYMYRQKYQAGNHENVGWTKPQKACVYNVDVMEETTDNIAVGANAVSKRVFQGGQRIERFATQKDLKTYMEKIDDTIAARHNFFTQKP